MPNLKVEAERFRAWAASYPEEQRGGEWEGGYDAWPELYAAVFEFAGKLPFDQWSSNQTKDLLFVLARDNETQYIARELRRQHPELLVPLTRVSIAMGEEDSRWQLAEEIGWLGTTGVPVEQLLLALANDESEYIRRRALQSLARILSPATERVALTEWNRPDPAQEWARMNALHVLNTLRSPHLESLLADAELDEREHLSAFARRMRNNETSSTQETLNRQE
jgi:hypothetical protein